MSELKPCPFCGGKALADNYGYIACVVCDATQGRYATTEQATEYWNTRADDKRIEQLQAQVDELQNKLAQAELKRGREILLFKGTLEAQIEELQAQVERECVWTKTVMGIYGEYDNWATSCGEDFAITEEWHEKPTPFCSNCGGKTKESELNKGRG